MKTAEYTRRAAVNFQGNSITRISFLAACIPRLFIHQ